MSNLLKSKLLLGVMTVAIMFVGAVAVNATTASASCSITSTLKLGSTGAQVVCLQTALGGLTADGNFGAKTKAAVIKFQTNAGLTADGVFGPKSIAAWMGNQGNAGNFPSGCTSASGFSTTTGGSCAGGGLNLPTGCTSTSGFSPVTGTSCAASSSYPAGCTSASGFSPTTGASCSTGVVGTTNGTNGAIIASQSSAVSYGVTVNAGSAANLSAVKLQATSGPVQVTSVDVHMNVRPWLFFSQVTLSSNGTVLATLPLTSANATEITVGSDYLLNFSGLNYTVTPGVNPDLTVAGASISGTNRLPQTVWTLITNIKTVNGSSWTDSISPNSNLGTVGVGSNSVTISATGSIAQIYANISGQSPSTGQVAISSSVGTTTQGVVLGVFSLKSTNTSATLNGLTLGLNDSTSAAHALSTFSNVRLFGPGCTSGCGGVLTNVAYGGVTNTISFTNLTSPLPQDAWTDYTIKADVAGNSSGTVYLTLNPQTGSGDIVGTDTNYDNLTFGTTVVLQTSLQTLTSNSVSLSGVSITPGTNIVQNNYTKGENLSMSYTLTNNGNNYIYVSAVPGTAVTAVATGTTGGGITNATVALGTSFTSVSGTNNLDSSGVYYVIGPQAQRTFVITGALYAPYTTSSGVPVSGTVTLTVGGSGYSHAIDYSTASNLSSPTPVVTSLYPINFSANF